MTKFTPGEWKIKSGYRDCYDYISSGNEVICFLEPEHNLKKGKALANAKLIANAPLGYELAELILEYSISEDEDGSLYWGLIQKAKEFMENLK